MKALVLFSVGVVITGSHSCMTARGIRNVSSRTTTKTFCGAFQTDHALQELL
ncbi:GTP cyclohydrolase I [uncultured Ruminococcus sp.]|uniref:GTP cyclohydrolase I n=1 Tax=uncultured Ruminococcus sp. TaxID=165186 RepID=UPI0034C6B806